MMLGIVQYINNYYIAWYDCGIFYGIFERKINKETHR